MVTSLSKFSILTTQLYFLSLRNNLQTHYSIHQNHCSIWTTSNQRCLIFALAHKEATQLKKFSRTHQKKIKKCNTTLLRWIATRCYVRTNESREQSGATGSWITKSYAMTDLRIARYWCENGLRVWVMCTALLKYLWSFYQLYLLGTILLSLNEHFYTFRYVITNGTKNWLVEY